ncbi:glycoside hydrolase family 2 protein [candidate division KSB1 bacterium]|nr:glycoside hydrolase family 2 protein [candidate division KSB1 bacterium]
MEIQKIAIEIHQNWQFRQLNTEKWHSASVPGCVHSDLMQGGLIEDPFYRMNELDVQWIDKVDWEYQVQFQIDKKLIAYDQLDLVFKGLDTYATIYLNESPILNADNMFREWRINVKPLLEIGRNSLRIHFHSPITEDLPKLANLGYDLPAVSDQSITGGLGNKRLSIFARKAGYHYGWDWGPRLITSGIWRPVILEAWNMARIENIQLITQEVTKDIAKIQAVFEIHAIQATETNLSIEVNGSQQMMQSVTLQFGLNTVEIPFEIKNPQLWWTNGLGEPYLYSVKGILEADFSPLDEVSCKYGIRTLRVIQEKDKIGTSFYFELNGIPLFAKGANYIPNDNFLPRVSPDRYLHIVQSAAQANMNMLRVWGGGIYENDLFYELCDENGILIWHDFMFACAMYPSDDVFIENVTQEAIQNMKRLRNHPCLALWCGNNEIDMGWSHEMGDPWGWKKKYTPDQIQMLWNEYKRLFHQILPKLVAQYAPGTFYWPSSPLADLDERSTYNSTSGDMHYWGVWHGLHPFEDFKKYIGRFISEYGFQAFPELKSVEAYTLPADWDINSEVMKSHQRSPIGNQRIKNYMEQYYRVPESFSDFLYVGQMLQAEGIQYAIEAHRRKKPYCMGSLYWQINDCWPVASWSSIDYYGRWKALHYFAKKAFADILVSPTIDNGILQVFVISDRLAPIHGYLKLKLKKFNGEEIWEKIIPINIPVNSVSSYFSIALSALLKNLKENEVVLKALLQVDDQILAENKLYFTLTKNLNLPEPDYHIEVTEVPSGYKIKLTAKCLLKSIYLQVDESEGVFSDNYFDLLPGEQVVIEYITSQKINNFDNKLKILTLNGIYR